MSHEEVGRLVRAADARRAGSRALELCFSEQEEAIVAARSQGMTWANIALKLGVSEGQAKWVIQRNHTPEALARDDGEIPRTGPRPGRGDGISVSAASRQLGVTRRTIYAWARSQRLPSSFNDIGQTRILIAAHMTVDDFGGPPTEAIPIVQL